MAVSGAGAKSMFSAEVGTIGTSATFVKSQDLVKDFGGPKNILALPVLRYISESDDQTSTIASISAYVDGGVTHTGSFMGIAAQSCTSITWSLYCNDSFNNPTRLIIFF